MEAIPFHFPAEILKQSDLTGEFHIVGYAATSDFDMQGDIIADEALKSSSLDLLKNSTVLLNHDIKIPIGRVTKAEFDKHGLLIDVLISKTEPDIIQKIKEGVLNKFSIRGEVLDREKKYMPELERVVNVIKKMTLIEVSLVSVPANPEAKAIGWYISKALRRIEKDDAEGDPMPKKETVKSDDPNSPDGKAAAVAEQTKPVVTPDPEPQPAPAAPAEEPAPPVETPAEEQPEPSSETLKQSSHETVWSTLDRIMALGGEAASLAGELKSHLKKMPGTVPEKAAPAAVKELSTEEMTKRISDEVKKQLEAALKGVPAQRKGVIQPEPQADELKKTFEGLSPEKKLKVALALQQA